MRRTKPRSACSCCDRLRRAPDKVRQGQVGGCETCRTKTEYTGLKLVPLDQLYLVPPTIGVLIASTLHRGLFSTVDLSDRLWFIGFTLAGLMLGLPSVRAFASART